MTELLSQTLDPSQFGRLVDARSADLDIRRYQDSFWDVFIAGGTQACLGQFDTTITPIPQSFFGIEKANAPDKLERQKQLVALISDNLQFVLFRKHSLLFTMFRYFHF